MSAPQPTPPPIPVQPIQYTYPTTPTRPSHLTPISILSIILGCLGILTSVGTTFSGIVLAIASSASSNLNQSLPSFPTVITTPAATSSDTTEDASPLVDRQLIVTTLNSLHPISKLRQNQLDSLLQLAGKKILPLTGPDLTSQSISANITDSGQFPSGTGHANAGSDYYVFARGRIDIDDTHATFNPSGSPDTLRASATESPAVSTTATSSGTPSTQLTPADISQIITTIESRIPQKLTPAQSSRLRTELASPNQTLFNSASPLPSQIRTAKLTSGTLSFSTPAGFATIHSNGNYYTFSGFASSGFGSFTNTLTQSITIILSSILSLALAILLLVAGLLTLRNSPRSRRLHLIYAWCKLPLLLLSFASWLWFWYALSHPLTPGIQATIPLLTLGVMFAIPSLLALIYPVALLIVFNTRSVKDHYPS